MHWIYLNELWKDFQNFLVSGDVTSTWKSWSCVVTIPTSWVWFFSEWSVVVQGVFTVEWITGVLWHKFHDPEKICYMVRGGPSAGRGKHLLLVLLDHFIEHAFPPVDFTLWGGITSGVLFSDGLWSHQSLVSWFEVLPVEHVSAPGIFPVWVTPLPWTTEKWPVVMVLHVMKFIPHDLFVFWSFLLLSSGGGHSVFTIEVEVTPG